MVVPTVNPSKEGRTFYDDYFEFVGTSEVPTIYSRWAVVSMIGALLSRQFFIPFGHNYIYPNQYIMMIGDPGTRKGTAMGPIRKLLKASNYHRFGPDRTSAERFIIDLQQSLTVELDSIDSIEAIELINLDETSDLYTLADEFVDFIGLNNMNFINLLTKLWDNLDEYKHPKIHGSSVVVVKPTVNLFVATTPQGLTDALPPEAIGAGFTSRFIFVHAERLDDRITWPAKPVESLRVRLVDQLRYIRSHIKGAASITPECNEALDRMYKEFVDLDDYRFKHYSTRRFTHLLKLTMIFAAMRGSCSLSRDDAIKANTLLFYTERQMPRALGELGRAALSEVANNVLNIVASNPMGFRKLWKQVASDLNRESDLLMIMKNLISADKIQLIGKGSEQKYARKFVETKSWAEDLIDPTFLTLEEMK